MIVIAENDDGCRLVLRHALEADGHVVTTVDDGLDIPPLVGGGDVDLVILDLRMPGMNGWEVLRALRDEGTPPDRRIPVIVVSGQSDEETGQFVSRLGAAAFLPKPLDLRELRELVRCLLRRGPGPRVSP